MRAEEILQQLTPWRDACKRLAWKPITEAGDGGLAASKFAGMPWLVEGESYPCCGNCHAPMPLFLQLNLADLPIELAGRFGSGLLQLFYCTDERCNCSEAFSSDQLVRLVQPIGAAQSLREGEYPSLPSTTIIGWSRLDDYPSYPEHEEMGLFYDRGYFSDDPVMIHCPLAGLEDATLPLDENEEAPETYDIAEAAEGDKLAGYPSWVQDEEYPYCPVCDRRMELVFQLDSNDHLPYMFGDVGRGHLTQCPEHKEVLTFAWAGS